MRNEIKRIKILVGKIKDLGLTLNNCCQTEKYQFSEESYLTTIVEYLYKNTDELYALMNSVSADTVILSDFYTL